MTNVETASPDAWFKLNRDRLEVGGAWTIADSARLDKELQSLKAVSDDITIDASKLQKLDSSGAWLLIRTRRRLEKAGHKVSGPDLPANYRSLLEDLEKTHTAPPVRASPHPTFRRRLYRIGKASVHAASQGYEMLGYLGRVTVESGQAIVRPKSNLRVAAIVHQIEE